MKIAELFLELLVDARRFRGDVEKEAQAAGDDAGKTFGKQMSKGLKGTLGAGFKVAAAVVATGFGIATAEGLKLNSVLNTLQADTGAVGEDWEAMKKVVRRENGRTTESLDEIADATKAMRQDLGLTGAEIDKYADKFFDAGLATKTNAATMVRAVDDIGDAYNLTIDRSINVIDQLIASQQKWGGDLQARIAAMPGFAKVIQALGGTVDDAIALENIAAASGLDLNDVQKALNATVAKFKLPPDLKTLIGAKAVTRKTPVATLNKDLKILEAELKKLLPPTAFTAFMKEVDAAKSPYDKLQVAQRLYNETVATFNANPIQAYVDVLAGIPDDTDRAAKAAELFGAKAGPVWAKIGKAVRDSGGDVQSFGVSSEQAGDKIGEIVNQLGKDPGRALQLALERISAALADVGSQPALTGLASFGTILGGFAPNLGPKVGGLIIRGFKGVGTRIASAIGIELASKAATSAVAGGLAEGVAAAGSSAAVAGAGKGLALTIAKSIGVIGITVAVLAVLTEIADKGLEDAKDDIRAKVGGAYANGSIQGLEDAKKEIEARLRSSRGAHLDTMARFYEEQLADVESKLRTIGAGLGPSLDKAMQTGLADVGDRAAATAGDAAEQIPTAVATGIDKGKPKVEKSVKELAALKSLNNLAKRGGIAKKGGYQIASEVAAGIRDARQKPLDAFEQLQEDLKHQMTTTAEAARLAGQLTSTELYKGLHSKDPLVKAEATSVKESILRRLEELKEAGPLGQKAMDLLDKGIRSKSAAVRNAALQIKGTVEKNIQPKTQDKGERAAQNLAHGINDQSARAAVANAARNLVNFIRSLLTINAHVTVNARVGQTQTSYAGPGKQHGGDVEAYRPYVVGEVRPELFVPRVPGHIYPSVEQGLAAMGGGDTFQLNMDVHGLPMQMNTPRDLVRIAQQLDDVGVFRQRRLQRFARVGG